jgi:tight adherence protein B
MSADLLYGVLALLFLLVSGLALALVALWNRRFSVKARALSGRLTAIAQRRRDERPDSLSKSGELHAPWMFWVLAHAPGVKALEGVVKRSGSRHTASEVMVFSAGLGLLTGLPLFGLANLPWWLALVVAGLPFALPSLWLMHREKKRRQRFEDQLPEALDFMTRALRAGHGLSVAIGMVGDELPDPIGPEFKVTFDNINIGVPFGDAMAGMAERIHSSDLNFLVIALMIQRKTGGNLTEMLGTLAKTVRERIKLKGKVRVLASEGKLSGVMIGSLPFVLGCVLSVINPEYMSTLWTTETGRTLMMSCLVMIGIGALWMRQIVQIKV